MAIKFKDPFSTKVHFGIFLYMEGSEGVFKFYSKRFKQASDLWKWIVHGNNVTSQTGNLCRSFVNRVCGADFLCQKCHLHHWFHCAFTG